MQDDKILLTTAAQARFHLENGETVCFKLDGATCYVKAEGERADFFVEPPYGKGMKYRCNIKKLDKLINDIIGQTEIFLVKGGDAVFKG